MAGISVFRSSECNIFLTKFTSL